MKIIAYITLGLMIISVINYLPKTIKEIKMMFYE